MVDPDRNLLSGLVEIDETSIRCRTRNEEVHRGRSHKGKLMIAGAVEVKNHDGKSYPAVFACLRFQITLRKPCMILLRARLLTAVPSKPMDSRLTTI